MLKTHPIAAERLVVGQLISLTQTMYAKNFGTKLIVGIIHGEKDVDCVTITLLTTTNDHMVMRKIYVRKKEEFWIVNEL